MKAVGWAYPYAKITYAKGEYKTDLDSLKLKILGATFETLFEVPLQKQYIVAYRIDTNVELKCQ